MKIVHETTPHCTDYATFQEFLSSSGLEYSLDVIKGSACFELSKFNPKTRNSAAFVVSFNKETGVMRDAVFYPGKLGRVRHGLAAFTAFAAMFGLTHTLAVSSDSADVLVIDSTTFVFSDNSTEVFTL